MAQLVSTYNNGIAQIVSSAAQRAAGTNSKVFTYDVPSFFKNAMSSPRSVSCGSTAMRAAQRLTSAHSTACIIRETHA